MPCASNYLPDAYRRQVSPLEIMSGFSPLSSVVVDFEADARMRFSRGQNPSLTLLLKAVDDAAEKCDHVGLTLVRARLVETLDLLDSGKLRQLMSQILLEVKAAERRAIAQVTLERKSVFDHKELLLRARLALEEDTAAKASVIRRATASARPVRHSRPH